MTLEILTKNGISMDRLQTLCMIADKGNIALAAGRDNLNRQSLFSRQIKELETAFGRTLTEKKGRTLVLKPEGRRLANMAREYFLALSRFANEGGTAPLTIRVGAGEGHLSWLLFPGLRNQKMNNPRVRWQFSNLQAEDIKERLLDQRLDFGLISDAKDTPRLNFIKLGSIKTSLFIPEILAKGLHLNAQKAIISLPLALLEGSGTVRKAIETTNNKQPPDIRYECTSNLQIAALIATGQAAGPLPEIAREQFKGMKVQEVDLGALLKKDKPLHLAWNPRTMTMSDSLERIREELVKNLSEALTQSHK